MYEFYLKRTVMNSPHRMPISREQYEDIDDALTTLWEALYLEQKFDFVVDNYLEFEETILTRGLQHMVLGSGRPNAFELDTALFNRRIMNFLTTYRTYVDSFPQHFNKIFHRDQAVRLSAEASFNRQYDSRIGYWLLPKLRNFVQHQGFPVHGSAYASKWISTEGQVKHRMRNTIELYLTPAELSKGEFTEEPMAKIRKMRPRIDLKFIIRDFMEGFSDAHVQNRELLAPKLEWAEQYLDSVVAEFLNDSGDTSAIALAALCADEKIPPIYVNSGSIKQRTSLVSKNGRLVNLAKRYISNEIFDDNPEEDLT